MTHTIAKATAVLFVPGDRPERFEKALNSGADSVIIDWEDAVAPEKKATARASTRDFLHRSPELLDRVSIRVNPVGSAEFENDAKVLSEISQKYQLPPLGVVLAKAEQPSDVTQVLAAVPSAVVVALIESAKGLVAAAEIGSAPSIARLAFGAIDFGLDTGMETDDDVIAYPRSELSVASRVAGLPGPLDSPVVEIRNTQEVTDSAREAKRHGFTGKLCIHPSQVEPVKIAFRPTEAEILWARAVAESSEGASQIDGKMVDRPLIERARRIIERAKED